MLERKKNLKSDLWIVLLDIIAVNGAYLLLLICFYHRRAEVEEKDKCR